MSEQVCGHGGVYGVWASKVGPTATGQPWLCCVPTGSDKYQSVVRGVKFYGPNESVHRNCMDVRNCSGSEIRPETLAYWCLVEAFLAFSFLWLIAALWAFLAFSSWRLHAGGFCSAFGFFSESFAFFAASGFGA